MVADGPLEIRLERPGDVGGIREVNRRAFGQDLEGRIVDALRENGAAMLSLVATIGERIVGHVMYSPASIDGLNGAALGPMAVLPEHQRQGIGGRLIQSGNDRLAHAGCPFIVLVGHPDYYRRFGFRPARARGITCEWEVPEDVFMVAVLDEAKMHGVGGLARYRPEFASTT